MFHIAIQSAEKPSNFCIMEDDDVIIHNTFPDKEYSSSYLFAHIKKSLRQFKIKLTDIGFISVVLGPGSFTGLKSGLSFVKGFAYRENLPIVGINSLETLAYSRVKSEQGKIISLIDARNKRVYAQVFEIRNQELLSMSEPFVDKIKNILGKHKSGTLIGSGIDKNIELIKADFNFNLIRNAIIDSQSAGTLGFNRYNMGDFTNCHDIKPIYISEPRITL